MTAPVTIIGHRHSADGSPATGNVVFTPHTTVTGPTPLPITGWLTAGSFSVRLDPSDTGWTYSVTENIRGLDPATFPILIPAEMAGQTVDLDDLASAPDSPGLAVPFVRLPDGGHRIYSRDTDPRTDPAAVVEAGDIWLRPLP